MMRLPSQPPATRGGPTPAQIRGARGMLGWSLLDLSRAARLSVSAVKRAEDGGPVSDGDAVRGAIRDALETEGIVFVAEGARTGVLLRGA